jgi:8-oxo-dGTP diphosphatase
MPNNQCEICAFQNPKLTVTAVILKDKNLLLAKRSAAPFKSRWDLIGGYLSENETPEAALRREIKEELGVGCSSLRLIDFFPGTASYKHYEYPVLAIAYWVELDSENFKIDKSEIEELRWFSIDKLPAIAFDSNNKIISYVKTKRII